MKKLLFCAGVLALAASCTDELETTSVQQNQSNKGITFTAVDAQPTTRGEFVDVNGDGTQYDPYWFGDTKEGDRIKIFSTLTNADGSNVGNTTGAWATTNNGAEYKATKSARFGEFTGVDNDNILDFEASVDEENPAQFMVIYPNTLTSTVASVSSNTATFEVGMPTLATQSQSNLQGEGVYQNGLKYAYTTAYPKDNKNAVGENVALDFNRVLPGVVFKTKNLTKYAGYFGNLVSVKLTSDGELKADGTPDAAKAQKLNYNTDAKLVITAETDATDRSFKKVEATINEGSAATATSTNTVNINQKWSDDARAYMIVAELKRDNKEHQMTIEYKFDKITFTTSFVTSKDWTAPSFYNTKELDIDSYDYVVTDKTLIINKADVLSKALTTTNKVLWPIGNTTDAGTAIANIENIIWNVDPSAADYTAMQKFTNAKVLYLNETTSLPKDGLKAFAALDTLHMPKVTTINAEFGVAFTNLKGLYMDSYKFNESGAINQKFFNSDVKGNLAIANIAAVEDMTPIYGDNDAVLSFQGYSKLQEVTVKDGLILRSHSFAECTALKTVNGAVNLEQASNAFACKSGSANTVLESIALATPVIEESAFAYNTGLKTITVDGKAVVPTKVGENAFIGNTSLEYMDLSAATEIGANAFNGCTGLKGPEKDVTDMKVATKVVKEGTFKGCTGLTYIQFTNAETIENDIMTGATNLVQIKFVKPFTAIDGVTNWTDGMFGPSKTNLAQKVTLFVNPEQQYLDGLTKLVLPLVDAQGKPTTGETFTFRNIVKE